MRLDTKNRSLKEANVSIELDKIPEGKKYLDLLDAVAGKDMSDEMDTTYTKICDILSKKALAPKDMERIIKFSDELSPKLVKAAEKLNQKLNENSIKRTSRRLQEFATDGCPVAIVAEDGQTIKLNSNSFFKVIWYECEGADFNEFEDPTPIYSSRVLIGDEPGELDIAEAMYETKGCKIKECEGRIVNNYKNSLGNYLMNHLDELKACKTKDDYIEYIEGALGQGNDNYVNSIIEKANACISPVKISRMLWDIILAGENNRVIR